MGNLGLKRGILVEYSNLSYLESVKEDGIRRHLSATCGRCRLMSKYKDWENEKLGPRRARFLAVRKQDKKAEASFGTRGGRGCNCRVRRIVVGCYKNKW